MKPDNAVPIIFDNKMNMKNFLASSMVRNFIMQWGLLYIFVLIYIIRALKHFNNPIAPDAALVYLPYAKHVLEQGFSFLLTPESIIVSPVSYLWPALFGGEITSVKYANLVAGVFMVIFVFGIGKQLHSRFAAHCAAFLFAMSPFLVSWIPTALSEPPFFLFTLIWFWSLGEIISGNKWAILIAAIALSLSILSRAVWFYPVILILSCIFILIFIYPNEKKIMTNLAIALFLGLVLPVLVITKNIILFGLPAIDTGTGNALYYGANIMTNGYEPPLLGLVYENSVMHDNLLYNKEHAAVAMQFFKERSFYELTEWYFTKISWVTLFTVLEASAKDSVWRVVELAMAVTAIWWGIRQKKTLILLMGAGLVLQIFQTAFVLYNIRYSTDNLELLLIPLAAIGIALLFGNVKMEIFNDRSDGYKNDFINRNKYGLFSGAIVIVLLGFLYFRTVPTIHLPTHVPVSILFESKDPLRSGHALLQGVNKRASEYTIVLDVPRQVLPQGAGNALWEIKLAIKSAEGRRCSKATLLFNSSPYQYAATGQVNFTLYDDGQMHTYLLGTANSNAGLFPAKSGKLTLKFDCQSDVSIAVDKLSLIAPHFIDTYFKKINSNK